MSRLFINDIEYPLADGFIMTNDTSETLDSATIIIPCIEETKFNAYDRVKININNNLRFFLIDTYVPNQCAFDNSKFDYTINLISETVLLDNVRLPNRKFTPNDRSKTMLYIAEEIMVYVNKQYPSLTLSNKIKTLLSSKPMIEKQFNKPTAREALNDILTLFNCIAWVYDNSVLYIDLSKTNDNFKREDFFSTTHSQNAKDYASSIRLDVQNAQSEDVSIKKEICGIRCLDNILITTENMEIRTQHPISEIVSIYCYAKGTLSYPESNTQQKGIIGFNITDYIVEKAIYNNLNVSNSVGLEKDTTYKRANIYYERDTNRIGGLSYNEKSILGLNSAFISIYNIMNIVATKYNALFTIDDDEFRNMKFKVSYKSIEDISFKVNKAGATNKAEIIDNQQDNYINIDKFAKAEQEKIDKLGNSYIEAIGNFKKLDDVPILMDTLDQDYILANRTLSIYDDVILFKGVFYKNYVFKSMFYGVSQKRRSYEIEMGNKCVTRQEIFEYDCKFSTENKSTSYPFIARALLMKICGSSLLSIVGDTSYYENADKRNIQYASIQSYFQDETKSDELLANVTVNKINRSLILNFAFTDNINMGMKVISKEIFLSKNKYVQQYVPYTDTLGELVSMDVNLFDNLDFNLTNSDNFALVNDFPIVPKKMFSANDVMMSDNYQLNKDSQEIFQFGIQFNILGNEQFIVQENLINAMLQMKILVIYTDTQFYKQSDTKVHDTAVMSTKCVIDYTDVKNFIDSNILFKSIKLYNVGEELNGKSSYVIGDMAGNVYLAVNKVGTLPTTIYLNCERRK